MHGVWGASVVWGFLVCGAAAAAAEGAPEAEAPVPAVDATTDTASSSTEVAGAGEGPAASPVQTDLSHEGQVGLSLTVTGGGLVRVVYDTETNACNTEDADNPVCTSSAPAYLMPELSYAVSDSLTLVLPFAIAVSGDDPVPDSSMGFLVRLFPFDSGLFNLFLEAGVAVALAPSTDVGLQLGAGLQIDPTRFLGIRLGAFPTAFFADELRTTFHFGGGVEVRLLGW